MSKLSTWLLYNLDIPFTRYDTSEIKRKVPIRKWNQVSSKDLDQTILIGTGHANRFLQRELRVWRDGKPVAVKTKLDWVLWK